MQFSDEFIAKWEHIIGDIEPTELPISCVKKVIVKLTKRRQRTINLQALRTKGFDTEYLESVFNTVLTEFSDEIVDIDFIVDVKAVAEIVQPQTDDILKGLA